MSGSSIVAKTNDLIRSGAEVEERRCESVCVLALVERTAPRSLVLPVKESLVPRMPSAEVRVLASDTDRDVLAPTPPDACVAIMGRGDDAMIAQASELAAAGVPVALVVESALDAPRLPLGETALSRVSVLAATNAEVLTDRLAEWLVDATDKSIALAANFPFCRRAKVRELINEYAVENAMGTARIGRPSELPSVTVNQARLALTIAAVYGEPLALGRIPEVLSAMGAGWGSRVVAEAALGRIPLVGWALEAGLDYLGTQATGRTLQHRFEKRAQRATSSAAAGKASASRRIANAPRGRRTGGQHGTEANADAGTQAELPPAPGAGDGGYLVYGQGDPS